MAKDGASKEQIRFSVSIGKNEHDQLESEVTSTSGINGLVREALALRRRINDLVGTQNGEEAYKAVIEALGTRKRIMGLNESVVLASRNATGNLVEIGQPKDILL